ncbi:hypothetical protein [Seonamhaeicola marinus]|uniref:Uncharacterized protein n=1 Tax=Seonamhaeicola marinus TaxID=1912246 RepID=A0A5D0HGS5_9FLAO|nr:hypothetical protein [Seonamhaeicola marinus]TYA70140.1 hypothetical protein FUA24_22930 [Seonamhaeicola marinus]
MTFNTASKLYCFLYGHNYKRIEKAKKNTPKLICKTCKSYFTYDSKGEIIPFSAKKNKQLKLIRKLKKSSS